MEHKINEIEERLAKWATLNNVPLHATFELTPLCNMKCNMCYARISPEELRENGGMCSAREWLELAEEAVRHQTLFVLLTGGEPLLHPEFKEIYLGLRKLSMIVNINTNGTLIDDEWADFFAEHPPRQMNITLYGASAETYEKVCGYREGFEKTIAGIRRLRERGISVKMNGTLTRENCDDYDKIIKLAEELDVYCKVDTYLFPWGRDGRSGQIRTNRLSEEMQAYYQFREKERRSEHFEDYVAHAPIAKTLMEFDSQKRQEEPLCEEENLVACRAGRSSYWIDYRMHMLPCIFLPEASWDLSEGFANCWKHVNEWILQLRLYPACVSCAGKHFCNVCAAALYAEEATYQKQPGYLCQSTKDYIECLTKVER